MAKLFKYAVIFLLLITALNALVAGGMFIFDPSGIKMGLTTDYLKFSPFNSFFIPGIVLFVINGLLNLFAAVIAVKNYRFAKKIIGLQGILLCGWIFIQTLMVRDVNPLHFIMVLVGIVFIVYGLIPTKKGDDDE